MIWLFAINSPIIIAAVAGYLLDKRRLETERGTQSFKWGYFVALQGILYGIPLLALSLYGFAAQGNNTLLFYALLSIMLSVSGYLLLTRTRTGWVAGTILTLNPVWWIINAIYGRNRWNEFK